MTRISSLTAWLCASFFLWLAGPANAVDTVRFNVTGRLVTSTCDFSVGDVDRTIALDKINVTAFAGGVQSAGKKDFTLSLINCANATTANFLFSGSPHLVDGQRFANGVSPSVIALWLTDTATGTTIPANGSVLQRTRSVPVTGSTASLGLSAYYWNTSGSVPAPSKLTSRVTITMSYL
ncbi:MAG: fimbrial protein [Collimonas sp.]|uniref:fimbrial protein n=1 Tax=Collimonas sp. TaxID=1963772 RepID=UPI003264DD69